MPVRQHAIDDELERLGLGHVAVDVGVARVAHLAVLGVCRKRRRRNVEGPTPEHELLLAELLEGLRLVLDRDAEPVGGVEGDVGGLDGAAQQRRVQHVGEHP